MRQVGRVDRADPVHPRQAEQHLACRWRRASTRRPVRYCRPARRSRCACAAHRRTTAATSSVDAGPHHRQRLAVVALAPVDLPGRQVAVGQHLGGADAARKLIEQAVHRMLARVGDGCGWRSRQRTCTAQAANSSRHSSDLEQRQQRAEAAVAGGADHAFGEIEPDQQADPAVGIHAVLQQAGQRPRQRQHLDRQAAVAGRRKPQLPGQAEHDQAEQAGDGERARPAHGGGRRRRSAGEGSGVEHAGIIDGMIASDGQPPNISRPSARTARAALAGYAGRTGRRRCSPGPGSRRCARWRDAFAKTGSASPPAA